MNVLVACEYSGVVRDAFIRKGHNAWSCDILPTENPGPHFLGDALEALKHGSWDLVIAHPPCTFLTSTGARWMKDPRYPNRLKDLGQAADFFMALYNADCPRVCLENPVGVMSTRFRKPDQYVEPYQFGHPVTKKTGLWLKGLPLLKPTNIVEVEPPVVLGSGKKMSRWYYNTGCLPLKDRAKARSATFPGIAEAMADQWG